MTGPCVVALLALFTTRVMADVEIDDLGELSPGRFYYFVSDSNSTEAFANSKAYADFIFARCREDYGGRAAWLDTTSIWDQFQAWFTANGARLFSSGRCKGNVWCYAIIGLMRTSSGAMSGVQALSETRWIEDPTDMLNPETTMAVDADTKANPVFQTAGIHFGNANRQIGTCFVDKDTGVLTYCCDNNYETALDESQWRGAYENQGWSIFCESPLPNFHRMTKTSDFQFKPKAKALLPDTDPKFARTLSGLGSSAAESRLLCGHECGVWDHCFRFGVAEDGTCYLYRRAGLNFDGPMGTLYEFGA